MKCLEQCPAQGECQLFAVHELDFWAILSCFLYSSMAWCTPPLLRCPGQSLALPSHWKHLDCFFCLHLPISTGLILQAHKYIKPKWIGQGLGKLPRIRKTFCRWEGLWPILAGSPAPTLFVSQRAFQPRWPFCFFFLLSCLMTRAGQEASGCLWGSPLSFCSLILEPSKQAFRMPSLETCFGSSDSAAP